MLTSPADLWRERLRAELTAARRRRDDLATRALRSAMAAIDNAEATEAPTVGPATTSSHIAGSATGLGAGDAARAELTGEELRRVVVAEVDERHEAADHLVAVGRPEPAAALRAEAQLLETVLADLEALGSSSG